MATNAELLKAAELRHDNAQLRKQREYLQSKVRSLESDLESDRLELAKMLCTMSRMYASAICNDDRRYFTVEPDRLHIATDDNDGGDGQLENASE